MGNCLCGNIQRPHNKVKRPKFSGKENECVVEKDEEVGIEIDELSERFNLLESPLKKKKEQIKKDEVEECFVPLNEEEEDVVAHALSNSNRKEVSVSHESSNIDITGEKLQCSRPGAWINDEDAVEECFVPLSEEEEDVVAYALSNSNRKEVLVSHESSNIDITGEKLQCLRPGAWLNDEVINLYLELLKEREKREAQKFLKCHFFNTFFYKKLISSGGGYNFQSVRRWTTQRKLGYSLLECEKIFVPIHNKIHWCLAIINKKEKKFQYLDSLKGVDTQVLDVLAKYYVDEVMDKSGKDIDVSSWEQEFVTRLPQQESGSDCGMFMIKYVDFHSRDIRLCFNQGDVPYFRQRTANEILKLRAE